MRLSDEDITLPLSKCIKLNRSTLRFAQKNGGNTWQTFYSVSEYPQQTVYTTTIYTVNTSAGDHAVFAYSWVAALAFTELYQT